ERLARNIEATCAVPAALMARMFADRYAEHHDFHGPAERAAQGSPYPVAIVPRTGLLLGAGTPARPHPGPAVPVGSTPAAPLFAPIEGTDQVLRMGPVPIDLPPGGPRGGALVVLFALGLSVGVHVLLGPLRRQLADLRRTAEALGRGELTARAEVGSRDAVGA